MSIDNERKTIRALNHDSVNCCGSVTFTIEYQGAFAKCRALVSSSITDELIISRLVLQDLDVLPRDFPRRIPVNDDDSNDFEKSPEREEMEMKAKSFSKKPPSIRIGSAVLVQNPITREWNDSATVVRRKNDSYTVRNLDGKYFTRDRKFLRND